VHAVPGPAGAALALPFIEFGAAVIANKSSFIFGHLRLLKEYKLNLVRDGSSGDDAFLINGLANSLRPLTLNCEVVGSVLHVVPLTFLLALEERVI
jgi:hypothetical protein